MVIAALQLEGAFNLGTASRADEALTQALKQALALVDVKMLDHFVVAETCAVGFAERALL
jgi:DNA repair protein RadC